MDIETEAIADATKYNISRFRCSVQSPSPISDVSAVIQKSFFLFKEGLLSFLGKMMGISQ